MENLLYKLLNIAQTYPELAKEVTTVLRWVFVVLAAYILLVSIFSLLTTRCTPEIWGFFLVENGGNFPITHWENVIGRSRSADINIPVKTVSNNHAILNRRDDNKWIIKVLSESSTTAVNGYELQHGSSSVEESRNNEKMRRLDKEPVAPWKILVAITLFQMLTIVQLIIGMGEDLTAGPVICIVLLCIVMWTYVTIFKAMGSRGFEMEMIAFFMTTINLAVTSSWNPANTTKQFVSMMIGLALMIFMCLYMRDLDRTRRLKPVLIGLSVILLLLNLLLGTIKYGAANWITIGGFSIQPSEIVKLAFICVGAGTLEELYQRNSTIMYAGFSFFCLGCLAIMGDFGTALIFFTTYLVVSFLRSGDLSRMILTFVGACLMGVMILRFKPYIASRFAVWGHVWDFADDQGYQQTRTMSFGAGGGMLGLGAGNGSLKYVGASSTDLVFGFVMEEWGFIIAVLLVLCVITLTLFAVMNIVAGRSTFYTICACGAATMFLLQTILNVFGAVDLFPLTGVTFPFVSTGGTSMLASWAMLSYFKAADMRQSASLAVRKEV